MMALILAADLLAKVIKHFGIVLVEKKQWEFIITRINVPIKTKCFGCYYSTTWCHITAVVI